MGAGGVRVEEGGENLIETMSKPCHKGGREEE